MTFSAKFELSLTWAESRVRWRGLRNDSNLNLVPLLGPQGLLAGRRDLWLPSLIFTNSPLSERTVADPQAALTVAREEEGTPAPLTLPMEALYYSGAGNPITYRRTYKLPFACLFDLQLYPFDRQECRMLVDPGPEVRGLVVLRPGALTYLGPRDMMQVLGAPTRLYGLGKSYPRITCRRALKSLQGH